MKELVLGMDGGGSKTQLCLAHRDGTIVHFAEVGGSNPHDKSDWEAVFAELAAGISGRLPQIRSATIGVGGYGESSTMDGVVDETLRRLFPIDVLDIENDVYLANDAAFLGHAGLLLIAGTGSMLVGRAPDGRRLRVGGWGVPVGDEGSAYWIGREAISLASRMLDGRVNRTAFADTFLAAVLGSQPVTTEELFEWLAAMPHPRSQIAGLSRLVDRLAGTGDSDAIKLLDRAADLLAEHVVAGRGLSGLGDASAWSVLGGMSGSPRIKTGLTNRLGKMTPPALSPCGGAIWRAARAAGWSTDEAWVARLRRNFEVAERRLTPEEMEHDK